MMTETEYQKILSRICSAAGGNLERCDFVREFGVTCCDDTTNESCERLVNMRRFVERWADEHPAGTRQSEFLKMFPDAKIDDDGILALCPEAFSPKEIDDEHCHKYNKCEECRKDYWLTEVQK